MKRETYRRPGRALTMVIVAILSIAAGAAAGYFVATRYPNLTTGTRLTDAHNGLRVLERSVVERLDITQNRMAHASEIVAQIGAMRFDGKQVAYAEEPVHILYTDYSRAKGQSLWNAVNILAELIWR